MSVSSSSCNSRTTYCMVDSLTTQHAIEMSVSPSSYNQQEAKSYVMDLSATQ